MCNTGENDYVLKNRMFMGNLGKIASKQMNLTSLRGNADNARPRTMQHLFTNMSKAEDPAKALLHEFLLELTDAWDDRKQLNKYIQSILKFAFVLCIVTHSMESSVTVEFVLELKRIVHTFACTLACEYVLTFACASNTSEDAQ